MEGEIRDLISGNYFSEDCMLHICKNDDGVSITHVDTALDIFYHWIVSEDGQVMEFEIGCVSEI